MASSLLLPRLFYFVYCKRLLAKMQSFGVVDVVVWWIEAYFSGRVSRVHVGGEISGSVLMRSGVAQGSAIGSFLFLLFVKDHPDALEVPDDVNMVNRVAQNKSLSYRLIRNAPLSGGTPMQDKAKDVANTGYCLLM